MQGTREILKLLAVARSSEPTSSESRPPPPVGMHASIHDGSAHVNPRTWRAFAGCRPFLRGVRRASWWETCFSWFFEGRMTASPTCGLRLYVPCKKWHHTSTLALSTHR